MEMELCRKCNGQGTIICHCGGDVCVCGLESYDCPFCDSGVELPEDYDDEPAPERSQP